MSASWVVLMNDPREQASPADSGETRDCGALVAIVRDVDRDDVARRHAALALGRSGGSALLVEEGRNPGADPWTRRVCGEALLASGETAAATEMLSQMLLDGVLSWELRRGVLMVIAGAESASESVIERIVEIGWHPRAQDFTRHGAAVALERLGRPIESFHLYRALARAAEVSPWVRREAAVGLGRSVERAHRDEAEAILAALAADARVDEWTRLACDEARRQLKSCTAGT